MRRIFLNSRLTRVVCNYVVVALACSMMGAQEASKTRLWGQSSGSFRLSIASDKNEYRQGETIRIAVALQNASDRPSYVQRTPAVMFYDMDVRLPVTEWIRWKPQAMLLPYGQTQKNPSMTHSVGFELRAGHELIDEIEIDKLYDLRTIGEYSITFSCKLPMRETERARITVTSNTIKVNILAMP